MFVCIDKESNQVTSVLAYEPNVPPEIEVVEITDEENQKIKDQTHYFDLETRTVKPLPQSDLDKQQIEKDNLVLREKLSSSDWKVMRHLRQKALGIPTTLSDEEYIALEQDRQNTASSIINV